MTPINNGRILKHKGEKVSPFQRRKSVPLNNPFINSSYKLRQSFSLNRKEEMINALIISPSSPTNFVKHYNQDANESKDAADTRSKSILNSKKR